MSQLRLRRAVTPPRGRYETALPLVDALVAVERPDEPMICLRPAAITAATSGFVTGFPGDVLYAVKCNPEPVVLEAVWSGGVRHFDCASDGEVALVRRLFPEANIHFMHPVKARRAIRTAYARQGVRSFVLDSADELDKILQETGGATELDLIVRLAPPATRQAVYQLSGKFGASRDEAAALLRAARPHAVRLGVSFHVGSQCLDPLAWRRAIELAGDAIRLAGVPVEIIDVGGGFPVSYPDMQPPPLGDYFAEIGSAFHALGVPATTRLWAEPGRALVGGGASVVVQVQLRRGAALYINDGVYGSLSDAGAPGFRFPCRLIRRSGAAPQPFELFGPTCDSVDHMRGPFLLPADIREGDWVEIGQLGAYGACLRTAFNGFDQVRTVEVRDAPMLSTPGYEPAPLAAAA